jgi:hypothetical protein
VFRLVLVVGDLVGDVPRRLPHEQEGETQAQPGEGQAEEEGGGTESGGLGDPAGEPRGQGHGAVSGRLVEAHGSAPPPGSDQIDLHDHRHRPGEALVDPEEHVGSHHPAPGGSEDQHQRNRDPEQPAGQEHRLAAEAIGEGPGEVVDDSLGEPEGGDEREHGGVAGEGELALGQQG